MARSVGIIPYKIDLLGVSPCRRPCLCWFDWVVEGEPGVSILTPKCRSQILGSNLFWCWCHPWKFWVGASGGENHKLPTFTTGQPKQGPGFKPAGLQSCNEQDVLKLSQDRWEFPPYVYKYEHGLIHKKKGWKVPGVNERESILGPSKWASRSPWNTRTLGWYCWAMDGVFKWHTFWWSPFVCRANCVVTLIWTPCCKAACLGQAPLRSVWAATWIGFLGNTGGTQSKSPTPLFYDFAIREIGLK